MKTFREAWPIICLAGWLGLCGHAALAERADEQSQPERVARRPPRDYSARATISHTPFQSPAPEPAEKSASRDERSMADEISERFSASRMAIPTTPPMHAPPGPVGPVRQRPRNWILPPAADEDREDEEDGLYASPWAADGEEDSERSARRLRDGEWEVRIGEGWGWLVEEAMRLQHEEQRRTERENRDRDEFAVFGNEEQEFIVERRSSVSAPTTSFTPVENYESMHTRAANRRREQSSLRMAGEIAALSSPEEQGTGAYRDLPRPGSDAWPGMRRETSGSGLTGRSDGNLSPGLVSSGGNGWRDVSRPAASFPPLHDASQERAVPGRVRTEGSLHAPFAPQRGPDLTPAAPFHNGNRAADRLDADFNTGPWAPTPPPRQPETTPRLEVPRLLPH